MKFYQDQVEIGRIEADLCSFCGLRFNTETILEKLRNGRLVFVGDSIGRNQWESLLCLLLTVVSSKSSIYEVNGRPITKYTGFLVFKFADFNCTIKFYRALYLVLQSRPPAGSPNRVRTTLKLDEMDWTTGRWKGADVNLFTKFVVTIWKLPFV